MQNTVASAVHPSPVVKPGHRLVPAKVGRSEQTSVIVYIEDPTWCTEDHVAEPVRDIEDIMHRSEPAGFGVLSFSHNIPDHELYAYIEADPLADKPVMKAAHIVVEDGGNEYSYLTPAMADELADKVVGFAAHLRHLARDVRQANQTSGDSAPDMDEALRRVRVGKWQSLAAADIAALPIAHLLKVFGVTVVEADIDGAELHGEPGRMELRVPRTAGQQMRDSEARRLLAAHVSEARHA